jgi:glycine cleavage system H protein
MSMAGEFPEDLRYSESDEWVRREDGDVVCGVTAYAAEQLGDIVYLQLPAAGAQLTRGEAFGEIESVKAVSDLFSPVSGEVLAVNEELDRDPGVINRDPYGEGWIVRVRLSDPGEYDSLLDAAAYERNTTERH